MNQNQFFAELPLLVGFGGLGLTILGVLIWRGVSAFRARAFPTRGSVVTDLWLMGLCAAAVALSGYLVSKADPFDQKPFDRPIWLRAKLNRHCPRGPMVGSLTRAHLKPGTPRERVVWLLGTPEIEDRSGDGALLYRYYLGCWSGLRIERDFLDVQFDASDRVTGVSTWQSGRRWNAGSGFPTRHPS